VRRAVERQRDVVRRVCAETESTGASVLTRVSFLRHPERSEGSLSQRYESGPSSLSLLGMTFFSHPERSEGTLSRRYESGPA
jgi:hypothetical protein